MADAQSCRSPACSRSTFFRFRDPLVQSSCPDLATLAAKDFCKMCDRNNSSMSVRQHSDQDDQVRTLSRCG